MCALRDGYDQSSSGGALARIVLCARRNYQNMTGLWAVRHTYYVYGLAPVLE
jgi:hypothetical protein